MEDERNQPLPSPRGFRFKFWKIMTLTFLILVGLSAVSFAGIKTTSTSKFCSSCHEMKPEYYTWKASTHSEVECDNCHISPGGENLVKEKAGLVKEVFRSVTNTYTAPIQMPSEIPNAACEKCHNMSTRTVSPSGDLIIPHDKHLDKQIQCIECHSSVTHGQVAERMVTFKTDYEKWDEELGHSMMSDIKFTKTEMETCMECHKARKVSLECITCHTTGMYPESHQDKSFKSTSHGTIAKKDIRGCHSCHAYMSSVEIDVMKEIPAAERYLNSISAFSVNVTAYAKQNSFCVDCHKQKPTNHTKQFVQNHGELASKDEEKCLTCHNSQKGQQKSSITTCSSCHPSSHKGDWWKKGHPVTISDNQKVTSSCYTCHSRRKCSACHKE